MIPSTMPSIALLGTRQQATRVASSALNRSSAAVVGKYVVKSRDIGLRKWKSSLNGARLAGEEGASTYPKLGEFKPAQVGTESDGLTRFPGMSAKGLLRGTDYFGTVVFAVSGSVTAATAGMDLLGATIVGTITAIGGGTVRDAILLHKQPFWIEEYEYLLMASGAAFLAFCLWPSMPEGNLVKEKGGGEGAAMWLGDAVGVGAFAVIGAQNGIRMCVHPAIATVCGMVTATFGGLTRDVICGLPMDKNGNGRILHSKSDLYATTALAGAGVYLGCRSANLPYGARVLGGMSTAIALRFAATEYGLGLPTWDKPNFRIESAREIPTLPPYRTFTE